MQDPELPFFSVIVPVYNKELHISRSIESVLNQSFSNFELIVVCDPSTDNSNAEVAKFTDPRIRVFYRDEPGPGGYAARNLGISEAKAKWIAFLDADDEWYSEHLMKMKEGINKYPDCMFFSCARIADFKNVRKRDAFSLSQKSNPVTITFLEYLQLCKSGRRPNNTNSVVINKRLMPSSIWFPESRCDRSGDLYLWVVLMSKAKEMVWLSHVGSISYRDIVGVSKSSVPSIDINKQMVAEVSEELTDCELQALRSYSNRLIRTAWLEVRRIGRFDSGRLYSHFFWTKKDFGFCCFWSFVSLLPSQVINLARSIKGAI
ncbi:glycosyltransferase family 2 protein [Marinobacter piscensis]|uniref:glycosyltransferase family 2 protein n=1 Tax=Marinobacter piscensis TaxID=1562308 RepID=UPI0011A3607D|nr:glycosyltransferase family A protein [Marinobacter piscensis]